MLDGDIRSLHWIPNVLGNGYAPGCPLAPSSPRSRIGAISALANLWSSRSVFAHGLADAASDDGVNLLRCTLPSRLGYAAGSLNDKSAVINAIVTVLRRLSTKSIGSWQALWGGIVIVTLLDAAPTISSLADHAILIFIVSLAAAHVLCGIALVRGRPYARHACIALQLGQTVQVSVLGVLYEMYFAPRVSLLFAPSVGAWFGVNTEPSIALRYSTTAPTAVGINLVAIVMVIALIMSGRSTGERS